MLRETSGIIAGPRGAAVRLGMKRTTLQSRILKMGISRQEYEYDPAMKIPASECRDNRRPAGAPAAEILLNDLALPLRQPIRLICRHFGPEWTLEPHLTMEDGRAFTRRCKHTPLEACVVATIRLAYEMLDAGETSIEVLLSERTSGRADTTESQPYPLVD